MKFTKQIDRHIVAHFVWRVGGNTNVLSNCNIKFLLVLKEFLYNNFVVLN